MQIWSINYSLDFENVKIYKHCLYWEVLSTEICRKIYFNSFFWPARKLRQDLYLRVLILSFMESPFPTVRYFFCFFYKVSKLFKELSATLLVSKLYELSLWIVEHTPEMSSNVTINLYLRTCSIAIYGKFYLYCLCHLRLFSGCKLGKSGL